ncbi:uncharacterized protein CLUP02_13800 [Colletotrichum lupini]|uniref:Uncharacterized protein n=1 Tax=Colletotrichum lupini TaxID=145971 RepID=A0A9Q8T4X0_9PEZI|nr:uncharacterized protein CLUP02_13800 [Colletotrichum lupini]UQC88277.1 hypothetical protein CLUP02_13800 [Colletotrichum lupini]
MGYLPPPGCPFASPYKAVEATGNLGSLAEKVFLTSLIISAFGSDDETGLNTYAAGLRSSTSLVTAPDQGALVNSKLSNVHNPTTIATNIAASICNQPPRDDLNFRKQFHYPSTSSLVLLPLG